MVFAVELHTMRFELLRQMYSDLVRQATLFVCNLVSVTSYMRPEGPWQRLAAALTDNGGLFYITSPYPGRARAVIVVNPSYPEAGNTNA